MTHQFSDVDRRLLDYLKAKGRFTTDDSIMAGKRASKVSRSDLGDSWADVSSEEDAEVSEGGESVDVPTSEDESHTPSQDVKIKRSPLSPQSHFTEPVTADAGRDTRASRQRLDPQINTPHTRPSAMTQRRSARLGSRSDSVEPEFIMPSMVASGHFKAGSSKASPLSSSMRSRKGKSLGASRSTPIRTERNTPSKPPSPKLRKKASARQGTPFVTILWTQFLQPILAYMLSVIGYALGHLKPLLGAILAIVVVMYGLYLAFQSSLGALQFLPSITRLIPSSLSPCSIPIINMLPVCSGPNFAPGATPEFEDLMKVQSSFEDILQSTAQGSVLPLEMKRSEASIRDLKYVVTYSNLPSKQELVFEFQGFIDVARQAAGDLTKFNSKVGRAVDQIISTNKHTLQVIDGIVESEASRSALSKILPWSSSGLTQEHLLRQYLAHTGLVEEEIQRLILEAQVLLRILEDLDNRLDVIHSVVTRDGVNVRDSREELFASLWTKLGGNRNSVAKLDNQLALLKSVNTYRRAAWSHVTATLLKLQAVSAGLEDLRERVAMPEVVGTEVVPLRRHVETIQLGVDRLERVREAARGVEGEGYRRVLGDAEGKVGKDRMVEAGGRVDV